MTRLAAAVAILAIAAACSAASCGRSSAQAPADETRAEQAAQADTLSPRIRLFVPSDEPEAAFVEVVGLSPAELEGLSAIARDHPDVWRAVLQVSTAADGPAMLGTLGIQGGSLRFTPAFPFDRGRTYVVRFDPAALPRLPGRSAEPLVTTVAREAPPAVAPTVVSHISPSGGVVPENLLRVYIEFSAPMGLRGGVEHLTLVDRHGRKVDDPFLPLDYEFWNADRTRYTAFLDPGRVKHDLLPNKQMGRSLRAGERYTLIVGREWRDAGGMPLRSDHHTTFDVVEADTTPLDPAQWTIDAPSPLDTGPLQVSFPEPLDRGLLMRALGVVRADGARVDGRVWVPRPGESVWMFTPRERWRPGAYRLVVLSILEDLAGNQIGRPFEVDRFDTTDRSAEPDSVMIPFDVRADTR